MINYANMQIRLMDELTETSKGTRDTLTKFKDKILQSLDTVNSKPLYA